MPYNDRAKNGRKFSGPWTIYRRQPDAAMWEKFELACIRSGVSSSEELANLVRQHLARKP